jgi:hypothetical protein
MANDLHLGNPGPAVTTWREKKMAKKLKRGKPLSKTITLSSRRKG